MKPTIYFVDNNGRISDSLSVDYDLADPKDIPSFNANRGLITAFVNESMTLLNRNYKPVRTFPEIKIFRSFYNDFDRDGKTEILTIDLNNSKFYLFREGYSDGLSITADTGTEPHIVTLKTSIGSNNLISIQAGTNHYLMRYGKNPAYPYNYLYHPGIYLGILAFTLLIRNIQQNQSKRKYETEKKISELQLSLIRNQLDPHFTFNVINSIICSIEYHENKQAATQLRQFASLYREMLLTAGSVRIPLEQELQFCDNYLNLQIMRFKDRFDYIISVAENVDKKYLIPKYIIQIYAENAVKHGLSYLKNGGMLKINLWNEKDTLVIEIADNGIGRIKSAEQENKSTGKGQELMEELFSVFNRYYDDKISLEITDLYDEDGDPSGTRVTIRIVKHHEKQ
ncbi:MAG TPA: histidine kinase [Bacteroidales bacterium]|nr:histidine kinase [Bacteroidales bacterium]